MSDKKKPFDKDDTFVFGDDDQPASTKPTRQPERMSERPPERTATSRSEEATRFSAREDRTQVQQKSVLNEAFDARTVVHRPLPAEPKIDLSNPQIKIPPEKRDEPRQAKRNVERPPERAPERQERRPERAERKAEPAPETSSKWEEIPLPPKQEAPKRSKHRESSREETPSSFPPDMRPPAPAQQPSAVGDYYDEEVEIPRKKSPLQLLQQKPVAIGIGIFIFTIVAAYLFSEDSAPRHVEDQSSHVEAPPSEEPAQKPAQASKAQPPTNVQPPSGGMPSMGTVDALLNQFDQSYSKTQGQIGGN